MSRFKITLALVTMFALLFSSSAALEADTVADSGMSRVHEVDLPCCL
jgi:hypothetical protein